MIVPLEIEGRVVGTFNLGSAATGAYSPAQRTIVESLAPHLAGAVQQAMVQRRNSTWPRPTA